MIRGKYMKDLMLKKFESTDFQNYYRLVSDESVMAMITERSIPIEEAQRNYQKILFRNEKHENFGTYKVYNKEVNEFIGLGSMIVNEGKMDEAEIGYMILPDHWGKGYGSEVAEILIQQAANTTLKRLTAIIDPNNLPSRKILIKKGFISEKLCEIEGLPGEILSKKLV
jgi:[ribosomal protein S5]-alanine N-acetyltransferase